MHKICINLISFLLVFGFFIFVFSCRKIEIEREIQIKSDSLVEIYGRSATIKASIINVANGVFHYGYCWDTIQNPTISNNHTDLGITDRAIKFESQIVGLKPFTQYFVKPYISDGKLYIYGDELSFTTTGELPGVELLEINFITSNSFFYQGNVISAVIERGIIKTQLLSESTGSIRCIKDE